MNGKSMTLGAITDQYQQRQTLTLRHSDDGEVRLYAFKQVSHIIIDK